MIRRLALARRRLKAHRRPRLRRKLLPIPLNRPLDRAQADDISFSLASSWRITGGLRI
jgi:hypothetical protein